MVAKQVTPIYDVLQQPRINDSEINEVVIEK